MSARALPRLTHAESVLVCGECHAEAQVLGDMDSPEATETIEQWNRDHAQCGDPVEVVGWRGLVRRSQESTLIRHGGDAEKVMPMPRPVWASRDRDQIGRSLLATCYRSDVATVPATNVGGWHFEDEEEYLPARVDVCAKLFGNHVAMVGISLVRPSQQQGFSLTPDEARQLAEVLTAAADLAVTP